MDPSEVSREQQKLPPHSHNSNAGVDQGDDDSDAIPADQGDDPQPTPTPTQTVTPTPTPTPGINTIDEALKVIQEADIKTALTYLASPELAGRETGSEGQEKAADFIVKAFLEAGVKPAVSGSFFQPFSGGGKNVIGMLEGNDPSLKSQYVIIGAHYDHLGGDSGGTYYPGADDNGSGTVSVMFAAKVIGQLKHKIKRTVLFMAFSGEEKGLVGSEFYVDNPIFPLKDTIYMINLDMVGYLDKGELSFLGGQNSQYAASLMDQVMRKYPKVKAEVTGSAGGGSDHVGFISKNIPACFMHTGMGGGVYHQPTDTADKIDYPGLTNVAKMGIELLWALDQGSERPMVDSYMNIITDAEKLDHGIAPFRD